MRRPRSYFFETYQRQGTEQRPSCAGSFAGDDDGAIDHHNHHSRTQARRILWNFILMSLLFSANHGCVVACLSLATPRLGVLGNWQSGVLYISYTGSALFGATFCVKSLGPRNCLFMGMALYCVYVSAFWIATVWHSMAEKAALIGAAVGGVGAGVLWTAQGAFFATAAEMHAVAMAQATADSTRQLASLFAFLYLALELALRSLSSALVASGVAWSTIFAVYAAVAVVSACGMLLVQQPHKDDQEEDENETRSVSTIQSPVWYKVTAAWQLLRYDHQMQCMIGLNAVFGFASAFLNAYVNGEVLRAVLHDDRSQYVGLLTAWVSAVAAGMSLLFGRLVHLDKGIILTIGALCFLGVVLPFLWVETFSRSWENHPQGWLWLLFVYTCHGVGRATFESTLKATFADFFPQEREGAFANIILQNGLASAVGFVMSTWQCHDRTSKHCVSFHDGSYHNVSILEWTTLFAGTSAIVGYWRAARIQRNRLVLAANEDDHSMQRSIWTLVENDSARSSQYSS